MRWEWMIERGKERGWYLSKPSNLSQTYPDNKSSPLLITLTDVINVQSHYNHNTASRSLSGRRHLAQASFSDMFDKFGLDVDRQAVI